MVNGSEMMTSNLRIGAVLLSMLAALAACSPATARSASGTYVAADDANAIMLQIVEGADHALSGTLQMLALHDDGRLEATNARVTGAADGAEITLAVQPIEFLPIAVNFSGVLSANRVELTYVEGGEVTQFALVRTTVDDFVRWSDALRSEADRLQAEQVRKSEEERVRRAEEDRINRTRTLAAELERLTARGAELRAYVAQATERHRRVTAAMNEMIAAYNRLGQRSDYEAGAQQGTLEYEIPAAANESEWLRNDVMGVWEEFGHRHQARLTAIASLRADCQGREDADCARLAAAADAYLEHAEASAAVFAHAEADYAAERRRQEEIIAQIR